MCGCGSSKYRYFVTVDGHELGHVPGEPSFATRRDARRYLLQHGQPPDACRFSIDGT